MKLRKIKYTDLNSKQKEVFNFQKVAGKLSDYGYNCIKLADDWQGADFLAYHKDGRRWIIENDWLEATVALPLNMFYNTGIATYIWVLTSPWSPSPDSAHEALPGLHWDARGNERLWRRAASRLRLA